MKNQTILIVDDEEDIRNLVQGILEDEGYDTLSAANAREAYKVLKDNPPALIVLDIWLNHSEHDGLEILENVKQLYPFMPVIMISGHGNIETAVTSIQKGAYDFIEKPFKSNRLILMVQRALEASALKSENVQLQAKSSNEEHPDQFIGNSNQIQQLNQILMRVAPSNSRVLITGEAGVGKDVAARIIHRNSNRSEGPFKTLNCALLEPEKFESSLFGDSDIGHPGLLEQANGGTLYFDEVSDMPLETQSKILRVFQDHKFEKINGQIIETDIRVIASTNKNLNSLIEAVKIHCFDF